MPEIPGGSIASIDALASPGERGSLLLEYEAMLRDGSSVRCEHAWSRDGSVKPSLRSKRSGGAAAASGESATSLITEAEATAIVGTPIGLPKANGGRVGFAPGINVSNAGFGTFGTTPAPGQLCADWTLYLAESTAVAAAYWTTIKAKWAGNKLPAFVGVGGEAFASTAFPQAIVLQGRSILEVTGLYRCSFSGRRSNRRRRRNGFVQWSS